MPATYTCDNDGSPDGVATVYVNANAHDNTSGNSMQMAKQAYLCTVCQGKLNAVLQAIMGEPMSAPPTLFQPTPAATVTPVKTATG